MMLEIQFLAWDRHTNMVGLSQLMYVNIVIVPYNKSTL
jgi:hypothetical protein